MSERPRTQVFDALCAALLVHLHDHFPKKIRVEFLDLRLEERLETLDPADIWEWMDTFVDTVTWLEEEGFIRTETGTDDQDFYGVRLTMKGLTLLRAVPSSVQPTPLTLVDRLKAAMGSGGKLASEEALRLAMGYVFTAATGGS